MSKPISSLALIGALLKKEFKAYSRDTIYLALTLVVLVAVPIVFHFLPDSVDETITLAVSPSVSTMIAEAEDTLRSLGATEEQLAQLDEADLAEQEEGLLLLEFDDAEEMTRVIEGELEAWRTDAGELVLRDPDADTDKPEDATRVNVDIGIAFPDDFIADVATGAGDVTVTVYSDAAVDEEIQAAMRSFVREAAYQFAGRELPVDLPAEETIVLGEDRAGSQVTLQERMRPMLLFMILLMETFSMASLVSTEVLQRTVTAVLVTPAKVWHFLTAKTIFGTLMSLSQALIILVLIGGVTAENWSLLLTVLLMGAVMFTGVALFVGSAGRDFMGQLFYAMLFTVPLLIPSFAVLIPGSVAAWVRFIPTYPIIDVLVGATVYDATWASSWSALAYAGVWLVVLYGAGLVALKRKVESL
ncbi:MAG: ABC transporter permease [Anaerosomatales bacterium]|nr:ABC transporter permease [Anaerosomatales bacterium]